jgi:CRP-like cAMP-binding protein
LFVDRLRARSSLNHQEVAALLDLRGHTVLAQAQVDIVSPGETSDHACLIVDGLAGRFGALIDGKRQITALHVAGDMCDLHSVVAPHVSWALQALSPTVLLRIPHRALRDIARAWPNVAEAFWRDCSVDASVLSQWVVNVGRRDACSRLAHLLCEMAVRMENAGLGSRAAFRLQATQTQIGDALGLTSVHVNRTFRTLRDAGLIRSRHHEIHILDWDRLSDIAEFDDGYLQFDTARVAEAACR